ncbi:hypothetical protein D9M69_662490 [compost metagenome]
MPKMPTSTALMLPSATPMAATVPTSMRLAVGRIGPGLAGVFVDEAAASVGWSAVATRPASVCNALCEPASLAAARFATCSSISRTNFLYGAKKACATLVGFSISLVTVASQSRPWRS